MQRIAGTLSGVASAHEAGAAPRLLVPKVVRLTWRDSHTANSRRGHAA
jgi:hypothetical protein